MTTILFQLGIVIKVLLRFVYLFLFLRFIISWFMASSSYQYRRIKPPNPFVKFVYTVTDPIIGPFEGVFPSMRIDFSPVIVFFILKVFIEPVLIKILFGF